MSTPKSSKGSSWLTCESCTACILNKDVERHKSDCPPNTSNVAYDFIFKSALYGSLDIKSNEDIKSLSSIEKDAMVFLSQSAIQMLNLSIGGSVMVECVDKSVVPMVRTVWPTIEKSSSCILFTKNAVNWMYGKPGVKLKVSAVAAPVGNAKVIHLIVLNSSKFFELSSELNNMVHRTNMNKLLTRGNKIVQRFYGKQLSFEVAHIDGDEFQIEEDIQNLSLEDKVPFYKITERTSWKLFNQENYTEFNKELKIGGLDVAKTEIEELISVAFGRIPSIKGFRPARSVLLYGSSGTGKSLLAKYIAKQTRAHSVCISTETLYVGQNENAEIKIKKIIEEAVEKAPSIIIIEEIDLLCPLKSGRLSDAEKRIMYNLLSSLDLMTSLPNSKVFVIATTNKLDAIDPSFRRSGRLDREIEIPVPNPKARLDILQKLLSDVPCNLTVDSLNEIAYKTHGFVGADLALLCSNALMHATRCREKQLNAEDFTFALTKVRPSAMREVQIEVPNVHWTDIGGQRNLKLVLRQCVEWPLRHPDSFRRLGIAPPRGVLMFGPPGCSKTMIARALATESGLNFLSIKGPELFSKWVGESERAVREVFRRARQVAPSVVFFDEIDALGGERSSGAAAGVQERVLAQLLTELDGVTPLGDVTVLAATNRPDRIDRALLRPGRLDRIVYVPLPDEETRREIFRIKLEKMPVKEVDVEFLVGSTKGYSGAEINAVCHEAAMKALEEDLEAQFVTQGHFETALKLVTPRTPASLLKMYDDYLSEGNKNVCH